MEDAQLYREILERLYALRPRGVRLGLASVDQALEALGSPHRSLRFVHVAGTNGKGSAAAFTAAALKEAGYRVGLFTSPHMHRFAERIQIDGQPCSESELAGALETIFAHVDRGEAPELTFFEATTIAAMLRFEAAQCDIVVLEVGLGGRLDATNVVRPEVSVITTVALDHEQRLGSTLSAIAFEKAGIVKPGVPAVVGALPPEAAHVVRDRVRALDVRALWAGRDFGGSLTEEGAALWVENQSLAPIALGLAGPHQVGNAACALAALHALSKRDWSVDSAAICRGFQRARWPGRLERVAGTPEVLLDTAHNPHGCAALAAALRSESRTKNVLLFGAMADKRIEVMLGVLDDVVDARIYVRVPMSRAASTTQLAAIRPGFEAPSVEAGLEHAMQLAGPEGRVVVAGSIFVVAAARAQLLGLPSDPPIAL